ncbi:hypothetical protein ACSQ67_005860 [Phaseolus vulgaris]
MLVEGGAKNKTMSERNPATRRIIRSRFLKLKTLIIEKRDDLLNMESDNFDTILDQVIGTVGWNFAVEKPGERDAKVSNRPTSDKFLKYTFVESVRRRRVSCDEDCSQDNINSKKKCGEKQDHNVDPLKSCTMIESSRDSRRLARVAHRTNLIQRFFLDSGVMVWDVDWQDNDGALNTITMTHLLLSIEHPNCLVEKESDCKPLYPGIRTPHRLSPRTWRGSPAQPRPRDTAPLMDVEPCSGKR